MSKILYTILIILLFASNATFAQETAKTDSTSKGWTTHFQLTAVEQYHGNYHFPYSGHSSLDSNAERAISLTTTLFIGRRLWKNAAIIFNPEIVAGSGLSSSKGFAGFPNGEIYRIGNPLPTPFMARGYFQQTFPLKGSKDVYQPDDINQLQGMVPDSRITVNVGKFCLADFFDDNSYDHDARSQFLNWSLMANGAWDFAADTRGYTSGAEVELVKPQYAIKFAITQMSKTANALDMDYNLLKSNALALEFSTKYKILALPGIIRITGFRNDSRAPSYKAATAALLRGDSSYVYVLSGQIPGFKYGGIKYGYGINIEQPLTKTIGAFFRYGWNDGKTASWEFTDIDNNIQLGINASGKIWGRPEDELGVAVASNGISKDHQAYFEAGGYSYIIGDGHLNYGREQIFETYYRAKLNAFIFLSADYQLILNPGYNKDRKGPISIPGVRMHIEF
jgi:high affinity Mn2+ porin